MYIWTAIEFGSTLTVGGAASSMVMRLAYVCIQQVDSSMAGVLTANAGTFRVPTKNAISLVTAAPGLLVIFLLRTAATSELSLVMSLVMQQHRRTELCHVWWSIDADDTASGDTTGDIAKFSF